MRISARCAGFHCRNSACVPDITFRFDRRIAYVPICIMVECDKKYICTSSPSMAWVCVRIQLMRDGSLEDTSPFRPQLLLHRGAITERFVTHLLFARSKISSRIKIFQLCSCSITDHSFLGCCINLKDLRVRVRAEPYMDLQFIECVVCRASQRR